VTVAATFQNQPGNGYTASWSAPTALIAPSLGRNLSGGARNATTPLIVANQLREPRRTQVDMRFTKSFPIGSTGRLQANFDVYNVLNANTVLGQNSTYGPNWRVPTLILNGRLIQISGGINF
jgi:hypothetical protein